MASSMNFIEFLRERIGKGERKIECTVDDIATLEAHKAELETLFYDYYAFTPMEDEGLHTPYTFVGIRDGPFLDIPEHASVRKDMRYIIYILANSEETFAEAMAMYASKQWAKVIFIPTTFYLESIMYLHVLPQRRSEWEHADLVGCIAWSAHTKQPLIKDAPALCTEAMRSGADVISFLYRGDPLIQTAEHWHPGFTEVWHETLKTFGWLDEVILHPNIPSFYANYWACTPSLMSGYCQFALKAAHRIQGSDRLTDLIWRDASYSKRGKDIAKLAERECMRIWGVPFYTFHPFLFERLPCFWLWLHSRKISGIR